MQFSRVMTRVLTAGGLGALNLSVTAHAFAENRNGPTDGSFGLQRSVTPVMDFIGKFYHWGLLPLMVGIVATVTLLLLFIMIRFREKANPIPSKTTHHVGLELAWTLIPVVILFCLAIPGLKGLYFMDVVQDEEMTIKVTGNTWYWEYSYPDLLDKVDTITSTIVDIPMEEKHGANGKGLTHAQIVKIIEARPAGEPRLNGRPYLLSTDAPLVVPVDTTIKVLVTSNTNTHAFSVPQFGVKIDAVPGRINETWFKVKEEGTFNGQCSEICGVNHSFMPIEVKVVSKEAFKAWVDNGGVFPAKYSQLNLGGTKTAALK
ncbi:MAG: cytochrome c oxidase subunit II [Robiginitomaculum sp.]